jgi:hypothetical protein
VNYVTLTVARQASIYQFKISKGKWRENRYIFLAHKFTQPEDGLMWPTLGMDFNKCFVGVLVMILE